MAGIIKGWTNELTCRTTRIQLYIYINVDQCTNKFINVCLLIREVEDFSVCLWVVYLYVILPVNDAVIGFLRTRCLYLCIIHCTLMDRINRNGRHVFVPFKFLLNCNDLWLYLEEGEKKNFIFFKSVGNAEM